MGCAMNDDASLRVLVIEDDEGTRANLADILRLDGHQPAIAATATEAMNLEDGHTYAAAILDWTLPDGTAETLLPHLRRVAPQAAIIIITGTIGLTGTLTAIRHEVVDYILKPLDVDGLRASLKSIAVRRRLLAEKAQSEAAFRTLVEAAPSAIVIFRPDRTIVYFNPYATQVIGYTNEEAAGLDFSPLLIRDAVAQDRIDAEIAAVLAGGKTRGFEQPVWCKDGSRRWFAWNAQRLDDYAGQLAVLAVGLDISERRLTEQRLRAEHATARVLAAAASADAAVPQLLQAIGDSLGWDRGAWWQFDPASESLRCHETWYRPAAGAEAFDTLSRRLTFPPAVGLPSVVWATGSPAWLDDLGVEVTRAPALAVAGLRSGFGFPVLANGTPVATLVFFSRNPQLPDPELLASMASLGRQIGQFLARKLAEERAVEAERLAGVEQAMEGLIHEGRNALQRGQACLDMLAMEVEGQPETVQLIARLQDAQHHLHQLYEQVRDYAAPLQLDPQWHDLSHLLTESWDTIRKSRPERRAALSNRGEGVDARIFVDAASMRRVFQILLDNAIEAAADAVEIEAEWSTVVLDGMPALRVVLRDNGPGFSAEARRQAFKAFNTTKIHGIGLGLATAKRIVEAHGGTIVVAGEPETGAEVILSLPKDDDLERPQAILGDSKNQAKRKRTEAALREATDRLNLVLEGTGAVTWGWDVPANQLDAWTPAYRDMYGFTPDDPATMDTWLARIHPEDRERLRLRTEAILEPAGDDVWHEQFRILHPERGVRWLSGLGRCIRDEAGHVLRLAGVNFDITAQKEAESALSQSREHLAFVSEAKRVGDERLRLALDAARLGTWDWNLATDLINWNPRQFELFGIRPEDFRGTGAQALATIHPDDRPHVAAAILRAREEFESYEATFRVVHADGSVHWLFGLGRTLRDAMGRATRMIGVNVDVTEQKMAEDVLKDFNAQLEAELAQRTKESVERGSRLQAILDNAFTAIITIDPQGTIESVNKATQRVFGYTAEEMLGQNIKMLMPWPYREQHDGYLRRYMETGEAHIIGTSCEVQAVHKDGSLVDMALSVSYVDQLGLFLGTLLDISRLKEL